MLDGSKIHVRCKIDEKVSGRGERRGEREEGRGGGLTVYQRWVGLSSSSLTVRTAFSNCLSPADRFADPALVTQYVCMEDMLVGVRGGILVWGVGNSVMGEGGRKQWGGGGVTFGHPVCVHDTLALDLNLPP